MDTRPRIGNSVITDMAANPDLENSLVIDRKMIGSRADVRSTDVPVDPDVALQLSRVTNEAITSVTVAASDGPKIISRSGGPKVYANDLGLNDPLQAEERAAILQERKDEICGALVDKIYEKMVSGGVDNVRRGVLFATPLGNSYLNELLNQGATSIDIRPDELSVPLRPIYDQSLSDWIENDSGEYLSARLQSIDIAGDKPFAGKTFRIEVGKAQLFWFRLIIRKSDD